MTAPRRTSISDAAGGTISPTGAACTAEANAIAAKVASGPFSPFSAQACPRATKTIRHKKKIKPDPFVVRRTDRPQATINSMTPQFPPQLAHFPSSGIPVDLCATLMLREA
jgi:hypothetical protein